MRYAIKDLSYARELAKENGIDARCAGPMHEVLRRWPAAMVTATRR